MDNNSCLHGNLYEYWLVFAFVWSCVVLCFVYVLLRLYNYHDRLPCKEICTPLMRLCIDCSQDVPFYRNAYYHHRVAMVIVWRSIMNGYTYLTLVCFVLPLYKQSTPSPDMPLFSLIQLFFKRQLEWPVESTCTKARVLLTRWVMSRKSSDLEMKTRNGQKCSIHPTW